MIDDEFGVASSTGASSVMSTSTPAASHGGLRMSHARDSGEFHLTDAASSVGENGGGVMMDHHPEFGGASSVMDDEYGVASTTTTVISSSTPSDRELHSEGSVLSSPLDQHEHHQQYHGQNDEEDEIMSKPRSVMSADKHLEQFEKYQTKKNGRNMDSWTKRNKLRFSSLEYYGREKELKLLQECLDRCCGGGDSGDGNDQSHQDEAAKKKSRHSQEEGDGDDNENETAVAASVSTGADNKESNNQGRESPLSSSPKNQKNIANSPSIDDESSNISSSRGATTTRELVFVRGLSGTGKSTLVRTFCTKNKDRRLSMVQGKFDRFLRDEPFSAFTDALQALCSHLIASNGEEIKARFRQALLDTMDHDDEIMLLVSMIPNLQQVLGNDTNNHTSTIHKNEKNQNKHDNDQNNSITTTPTTQAAASGESEGNSQRIKHVFRKFCRILTDLEPLVIVLDDFHWADTASLDLLEALMNDRQNSKLFFIACYRADEAQRVQILKDNLQKSKCPGSYITDLEIGNLSLQHTHVIIRTLLSMEVEHDDEKSLKKTLELARICHERTLGNAFHLLQFLIMLKEESFLEFHMGLFAWDWDISRIESETAVTQNVVKMVSDRLSKLPPQLLLFLQLASCLGSIVHNRLLELAWEHADMFRHGGNNDGTEDNKNDNNTNTAADDRDPIKRIGFQDILELARNGNFLQAQGSDSHQWLHDNIQEAAVSSMPQENVDPFRSRLGRTLMCHLTEEELDREIFVVANLLTSFRSDNEGDAVATSDLFRRAAERATSVAAFQSAFRYAKAGIVLLPEGCWDKCFEQTLKLYSVATEASGFLGEVDDLMHYSSTVLEEPKCSIFDKLHVYFVKLEYLQNNGQALESLDLGMQILSKLGCKFPKNTVMQIVQTMQAVQRFKKDPPTPALLRQLPRMTDRASLAIVKVIFRLQATFYYTKQIFLYAIASARCLELLLEHGLCDYGGAFFFDFGNMLGVLTGDLKYVATWSEMGVLTTQLLPSGYQVSRVLFSTACGFAWSRPLHTLTKQAMRGYQAGMKVGDTESAMWAFCHSLYFEFMAGKSLGILEERCHEFIAHMKELRRIEAAHLAAVVWRLVLELSRSPESSIELPANVVDQVMESLNEESALAPLFRRATENMLLTYRREYVKGADLSIERGNEFLGNLPHQPIGMWDLFLRAVCLYAAADETGKSRYLRHARKLRQTIQKWLSQGNANVHHHAALLDAEDLVARSNFIEARPSYESSIFAASRGGFLHDAAIANERYAHCLLAEGDTESALFRFGEAQRFYEEWGSVLVANGLESVRASIDPSRQSEGAAQQGAMIKKKSASRRSVLSCVFR